METPEELRAEAAKRTAVDGIPRVITEGRIMKCDWILPPDIEDSAEMNKYIEDLLNGEQG